jgi:vitamin B12 transporter
MIFTKYRSLIAVFLLFLAPLAFPKFLSAQAVETLDTLLVEGRNIEEKLSAELAIYGHKVNIIQGETLRNLGINDLSQALSKLVPGLTYIPRSKADYSRFTLNGSHGILWLVDGIRINNRLFGSAYIDTIGVHMIERLEILTGGEGLFYGTEAIGGVVNVITKKPSDEKISGEVGASYGSFTSIDTWTNIGFNLDGHKFMVSASYDSSDGYLPYPEEAYGYYGNTFRNKRQYDRLNLGLKYSKEFSLEGYNNLSLSLQRNSGTFDYPYVNREIAYNKRTEYLATLKWDHDVTPNYSYYVKAYFHNWWTDYTNRGLDGAYFGGRPDLLWGYQDWGINIMNSIRWDSGHELLVGLDYQNYWGKDETMDIEPLHEQVYAAYFSFRPHFSFWEDWKLALGARYNYQKSEGASRGTMVWNVSSLLPIISNEALYFRTNIGTSFVLPTLDKLYTYSPSAATPTFGNPGLKPEETLSINAGFGGKSKYFDWNIDGFYNNIKDSIAVVSLPNGTRTYMNLAGDTIVKGYNVEATVRPVEGLSLNGSFTRNFYQVYANGDVFSSAKLSLQWDSTLDGRAYGIGIYGNYLGKRNYTLANMGTFNIGDYWLADVRMYLKPTPKFTITLAFENIFDHHYDYDIAQVQYPAGSGIYHRIPNPQVGKFGVTLGASYEF